MNNSVIKGLMVSFPDDSGPRAVINLSTLTEDSANELALIGITALFLGYSNSKAMAKVHNKIIGPLPVPIDSHKLLNNTFENTLEDTVVFTFNVNVDMPTDDQRAIKFGREVAIWFVYNTVDRLKVFNSVKNIENLCISRLNKLKNESELFNEAFFREFLTEIQKETSDNIIEEINRKTAYEDTNIPNYSLYKYNFDSEMIIPIQNIEELEKLEILISINVFQKEIKIIPLKPIPKRKLFMVSKSVSNLNLAFKRQFIIKEVNDRSEIMMLLRKFHENFLTIGT